jgi:arylsulfatase A-like enzyme
MDLFPTFGRLAGAKPPTDRVIDGRDIYPLMSGAAGAKSPHQAFFYYSSGGGLEAVRAGRWKLRTTRPRGRGRKRGPAVGELYDLRADIGEKANLVDRHPDVAERLALSMQEFDRRLEKTARPVGTV